VVPNKEIQVNWKKFENFFELWRTHRHSTKLIYVIGESHHCYIGAIGPDKGKSGLGIRYQKQYIDRSIAIFGLDKDKGQPSYAATFIEAENVLPHEILAIEALVQRAFVEAHGRENALFKPEHVNGQHVVTHLGHPPPFLVVC